MLPHYNSVSKMKLAHLILQSQDYACGIVTLVSGGFFISDLSKDQIPSGVRKRFLTSHCRKFFFHVSTQWFESFKKG